MMRRALYVVPVLLLSFALFAGTNPPTGGNIVESGGGSFSGDLSGNDLTDSNDDVVTIDGDALDVSAADIQIDQGQKLCLNGSTCSHYLSNHSGNSVRLFLLTTDFPMTWTANGSGGFTALGGPLNINGQYIYDSNTNVVHIAGSSRLDLEDSGAKGTCDSSTRGEIHIDEGGAGVADTFEVCLKDSADSYAWTALATP